MVDRVQPLKIESSDTGGTQSDEFPTGMNRNQDYVDVRGVAIQDGSSNDSSSLIERSGSDMLFRDGNNTTPVTLTELLAGTGGVTEVSHKALLHLIHFIDEGPAEGFTTGATKLITGTVFPTKNLWKRANATKLVEQNITWTGAKPTTIEWKIYDTDGMTALATVTDTITYSGMFEISRVRTIT